MFTGIIQEIGRLKDKTKTVDSYQLSIACSTILNGIKKGESIAVNGVCLTVVAYTNDNFTADVMPETLQSTNLDNLRPGSGVNLEQPVKSDGFFGGHLVTGHIDGTGIIKNIRQEKNARLVEISVSPELEQFMVKKGSVTLNGVSLTIVSVENGKLLVSLIPETWEETIFKYSKPGVEINIETDIIGKYVVKMMSGYNGDRESIDKDFLSKNGFI